jgi:hypothetical protein
VLKEKPKKKTCAKRKTFGHVFSKGFACKKEA